MEATPGTEPKTSCMLGKCSTLGLQPIKLQPEPLFCCFWVLRQDLIRISQVGYTICCVAECGTQLLILLFLLPGCCQAHTTIALMKCWGLSPETCGRLLAELCMYPPLQFWLWSWCQLLHSPAALAFEAHRFLLTLSPLTLFPHSSRVRSLSQISGFRGEASRDLWQTHLHPQSK